MSGLHSSNSSLMREAVKSGFLYFFLLLLLLLLLGYNHQQAKWNSLAPNSNRQPNGASGNDHHHSFLYQKAPHRRAQSILTNHRQMKLHIPFWPFSSPSPSSPSPAPAATPFTSQSLPPTSYPSPSSPQLTPQSSTSKKSVAVAVVVTAVATAMVLLVIFFFYQKLRHSNKKVRENPYSSPYGNPLLETKNRSHFWKDQGDAVSFKESVLKVDNAPMQNGSINGKSEESIYMHLNISLSKLEGVHNVPLSKVEGHYQGPMSKVVEGHYQGPVSKVVEGHYQGPMSKVAEGHSKVGVHQELGNPEWMGPSGFRTSSMPSYAIKAQAVTASRPSPYLKEPPPSSTPGLSAKPSQNAIAVATLHRLPDPKYLIPLAHDVDEAETKAAGTDSLFEGFWPTLPSDSLVASSLEKRPGLTNAQLSWKPSSTTLRPPASGRLPGAGIELSRPQQHWTRPSHALSAADSFTKDFSPDRPHAAATELLISEQQLSLMVPQNLISAKAAQSHSYAAATFAPVEETSGPPTPSFHFGHTNAGAFTSQPRPASQKTNLASPAVFPFTSQPVPPLPLPPALVSAAIVKAQQNSNPLAGEICSSAPVKSVAAALSSQSSEPHLAPIPSSRLSYRPMPHVPPPASHISVSPLSSDAMRPPLSPAPPSLPVTMGSSASPPPPPPNMKDPSHLSGIKVAPPPLPGANGPPHPPAPPLPPSAKGPPAPPPPDPPLPGAKGPPLAPPPPAPPAAKAPPRPPVPPPPFGGTGPPPPPSSAPRPPLPSKPQAPQHDSGEDLLKLKPLHWDKVRADPSQSMVWDKVRAGSFELNENEVAMLFGYSAATNVKKNVANSSMPAVKKGIIDSKKAQNIAIQLRALNISTQDICDALLEGDGLSSELLEVLVKMSPTQEEQKALLGFNGDRMELGPAERFLKSVLEVPNAFQRLEAMKFKACFKDDVSYVKESLQILEVACGQVRDSRLFLKLLEAVLKTGNHMNRGTNRGEAEAFKLDTLLKLSDVKSADGKTTLLQFVVEEIMKAEGIRVVQADKEANASGLEAHDNEDIKRKGLEVVLMLCTELESVKRAAGIDADELSKAVLKLASGVSSIQGRLKTSFQLQMQTTGVSHSKDSFHANMEVFCSQAEDDVVRINQDLSRVFDKVKQATAYFHGNQRETQRLWLLVIVRDFLFMLEKVCRDLAKPLKMKIRG